MNEEIKPCAMCGSRDFIVRVIRDAIDITCGGCKNTNAYGWSWDEALKNWNSYQDEIEAFSKAELSTLALTLKTSIKPCPFCAHNPEIVSSRFFSVVRCSNQYCKVRPYSGNHFPSVQCAIEAWNSRVHVLEGGLIVKTNDFIELVRHMRNAQKDYFKTRSRDVLIRSKTLEKQVDDVLSKQEVIHE